MLYVRALPSLIKNTHTHVNKKLVNLGTRGN